MSHHRPLRAVRSDAFTVRRFMTPSPHTIGCEQPIWLAHDTMKRFRIRHLPVLQGGKLVGVLSERDLYFVEAFEPKTSRDLLVEQAMTQDLFSVGPEESVFEVAAAMMQGKFGCAIVVEGTKVCGVFSNIDALRALIQFAPKVST